MSQFFDAYYYELWFLIGFVVFLAYSWLLVTVGESMEYRRWLRYTRSAREAVYRENYKRTSEALKRIK